MVAQGRSKADESRAEEGKLAWEIRDQYNGQWMQGYGGGAEPEPESLLLLGEEGYENGLAYITDRYSGVSWCGTTVDGASRQSRAAVPSTSVPSSEATGVF
jgi:hypothetical protein